MQTTELGLTFGQILALVTIIGGIIAAWINVNVRVKAIEVEIENVKTKRTEDLNVMETQRKENREEHSEIIKKLDALIKIKPPVQRRAK